jgi:acyl carrier protein
MTIEDKLRGYILRELQPRATADELTDDYPLLERQAIDSMGIFEIVSFIEREFDVQIADEELVAAHFGTIRDIAELIDSKQQTASPSEAGATGPEQA